LPGLYDVAGTGAELRLNLKCASESYSDINGSEVVSYDCVLSQLTALPKDEIPRLVE
jgi:hypothetical protein